MDVTPPPFGHLPFLWQGRSILTQQRDTPRRVRTCKLLNSSMRQ